MDPLARARGLLQLERARADWLELDGLRVPRLTAELWTARQRQANSLHEVSYRACFKPQLPRFFIERLTRPGDLVYDPFAGRGTTALEAALLDRVSAQNDVNPLSALLARPRLNPPDEQAVLDRLLHIETDYSARADHDISMFFHPRTEAEIVSLRRYLTARAASGAEDSVDRWIRMVATNRLTGHSPGFFSVYSLPPNQAVSAERQRKINRDRGQQPPVRDVRALVLKKTRALLRDVTDGVRQQLLGRGPHATFLTGAAAATPDLTDGSVHLTVTSPPFLDVVQYARDNWLRAWFNNIDPEVLAAGISMARTVVEWSGQMQSVLAELSRVTRAGGWVAFEVGDIRAGAVRLDETIAPFGPRVGLAPVCVLINDQIFTKTANIWGVGNNARGTNSNRIVVFQKR